MYIYNIKHFLEENERDGCPISEFTVVFYLIVYFGLKPYSFKL